LLYYSWLMITYIYSWKEKCKFAQENIYSIVMSCVVVTKSQKEFGMSCTIASHQSIQKKRKTQLNVQVRYKVSKIKT
jgi:hypothetical protein